MSGFNNIWSQRSKVALGRLEQWKIYPKLVTEYLQCYLDPEVTIFCEQRLFIDEQISLKKRIGEMKWSRKKIINPYWPGYVWDLVLKALKSIHAQRETVKAHLSSGKFPNSVEVSFDLT